MNDTAQHVVAEPAANAVTHARVPGRDFELRLLTQAAATLRIEVGDPRGDRPPRFAARDPAAETGRGLARVPASEWE